jgi:hypothetical protein
MAQSQCRDKGTCRAVERETTPGAKSPGQRAFGQIQPLGGWQSSVGCTAPCYCLGVMSRGINELRQIVGCGTHNDNELALLPTPIPEPAGVALFKRCLIGFSLLRQRRHVP